MRMPDALGGPRNPFHVFLFLVVLVNGIAQVFGAETSTVLGEALPTWALRIYGCILATGAVAVLFGLFSPADLRDVLLVKRIGYVALAIACGIFSTAVVFVNHTPGGLFSGSITAGFAGICWWQARAISRVVKKGIDGGEGSV
jgi:hypothetical protein